MSDYSRHTTFVEFASHCLYYGCNVRCTSRFVVYPSSFFVLWILMNQSFQSPHPEVGMVSLLYDSATNQVTVFVQNFKSYYMPVNMSSTCQEFFTDMLTWKKDLHDSPTIHSPFGHQNLSACESFCHKSLTKVNMKLLMAHNWQKWKRVFLTCPCHKIYRDKAVGLKSCKYTWKITIFVKMWNLGQYRENLIFCQ